MQKKFKKGVGIILAAGLFTISIANVASATSSGYKSFPAFTTEKWKNSTAYLCYAAAAKAKGDLTYTYFKDYATLTTDYKDDSNRVLYIKLMEDDVLFNDEVKQYRGKFDKRKLSSITYKSTTTSGNIENNNEIELFVSAKLEKHDNDKISSVSAGLFKFNVGTN